MNSRRLFSVALFVAIFTMAVRPTLDPDMWWHLRTGQRILEEGLPRQDVFSFTVPNHRWITHEWLSEVFMWSVYQIGRLPGLILIFSGLTLLTFWLVYRRSVGKPYVAGFLTLLAALATAPFWGVRPQLFNMLFVAVFLQQLEGWRQGKKRATWYLPPLIVIWANMHGGYLLGIALMAVYLLGGLADRFWGRRWEPRAGWGSLRQLGLVTPLCFLAAALNPNGPALWSYPFFTLESPAMQQYIQEWQSPDFHRNIFLPFAALLALGIAAWLSSGRRPAWTDLMLFGGTAGAGMLSARNIPIFAISATPLIATAICDLVEGSRWRRMITDEGIAQPPLRFRVINWAILVMVAVVASAWIGSVLAKNSEEIASRYPVEAVDFLERNGLSEQRGYNSYNWGGYLVWRGLKVFVDGRADVYGDDFLFFYRRTFDLTAGWQEPLDQYDVSYVLIEDHHPLGLLLEANEDWQPVYQDEVAAIYARDEL